MELMVNVIGMKCFKGNVQGSSIDSGSLYCIVRLDERFNRKDESGVNWKFGDAIEEWKLPNAEMVMRMSHLKPSIKNPVPMKITIERLSNGSETREVVIDVSPASGTVVDQETGEIKPVQHASLKKAA